MATYDPEKARKKWKPEDYLEYKRKYEQFDWPDSRSAVIEVSRAAQRARATEARRANAAPYTPWADEHYRQGSMPRALYEIGLGLGLVRPPPITVYWRHPTQPRDDAPTRFEEGERSTEDDRELVMREMEEARAAAARRAQAGAGERSTEDDRERVMREVEGAGATGATPAAAQPQTRSGVVLNEWQRREALRRQRAEEQALWNTLQNLPFNSPERALVAGEWRLARERRMAAEHAMQAPQPPDLIDRERAGQVIRQSRSNIAENARRAYEQAREAHRQNPTPENLEEVGRTRRIYLDNLNLADAPIREEEIRSTVSASERRRRAAEQGLELGRQALDEIVRPIEEEKTEQQRLRERAREEEERIRRYLDMKERLEQALTEAGVVGLDPRRVRAKVEADVAGHAAEAAAARQREALSAAMTDPQMLRTMVDAFTKEYGARAAEFGVKMSPEAIELARQAYLASMGQTIAEARAREAKAREEEEASGSGVGRALHGYRVAQAEVATQDLRAGPASTLARDADYVADKLFSSARRIRDVFISRAWLGHLHPHERREVDELIQGMERDLPVIEKLAAHNPGLALTHLRPILGSLENLDLKSLRKFEPDRVRKIQDMTRRLRALHDALSAPQTAAATPGRTRSDE